MHRRPRLGELLVARGLVSQDHVEAALLEQRHTREPLGRLLIRAGRLTEPTLLPVVAEQLGLAYVDLEGLDIPPEALAKIPISLATRYHVIPIHSEDHTLQVALADPFNLPLLDELKLVSDCTIIPTLAAAQAIQQAIQRCYGIGAEAVERLLQDAQRPAGWLGGSAAQEPGGFTDDSSIAAFVNTLIRQAVQDRATDIHLEPFGGWVRVRERVDGLLYEVPIPADLGRVYPMVVSRIKVMARLDIAEKRLPQDGRISLRLSALGGPEPTRPDDETFDETLDVRISVLPTAFGEAVDIRLLSTRMLYNLSELGLAQDHLAQLSRLLERPHGIIFVTGPTGSGKTTTLYACLTKLNAVHRKILTIEDPIEYQVPGITQLQVHPKIGLSFAQGLRSMLRHDPDIMMVGEVRDPETAEITIRSALTGHLVFSTLHTNDAAGGIARLLDIGIEPYLVASSVLCFIAQRLVRVICLDCQEPAGLAPHLAEPFGWPPDRPLPATLRQGRGCPGCKGTGYKGRTAIYEFLVVDGAVQDLILRRAPSAEIVRAAQHAVPPGPPRQGQARPGDSERRAGEADLGGGAGMRTLRQDGWAKILQGMTTPEEVLRVT